MKRYVIIGNGIAAVSALRAIRNLSRSDQIFMISKEDCPAYSPVLETYYLSNKIPYDNMFIVQNKFYKENEVSTIFGLSALKIFPNSKEVYLSDGKSLRYDKLIIATGSSPLRLSIRGVDLPGIFTLWTAEDAKKIRQASEKAKKVTIVGGGLIGIQVLDALAQQGKRLSLIELTDQLMPSVLDQYAAEFLLGLLLRNDIEVMLHEEVLEIGRDRKKKVLTLSSGKEIQSDMVIMAVGIKPNVDFLKRSGVIISHGILVDENARTNLDSIYAAGDVAERLDPITGEHVMIPTWINAVEMGWIAGINMTGGAVYLPRRVRTNIFSAFGFPFVSIGFVDGDRGCECVVKKTGDQYRKLVFKNDNLVGAILGGCVDDAGVIVNLIERQVSGYPLKEELATGDAFASFARPIFC